MICIGLLICCSFVSAVAQQQTYQRLPADLPSHYGIMGVDAVDHDGDVFIKRVYPDGPAALAGLQPGDHILAVDAYSISSTDEFSRYIQSIKPGGQARVTIRHDGEKKQVSVGITDVGNLYELMHSEDRIPPPSAQRHVRWLNTATTLEHLVVNLARVHGVRATLDSLEMALQRETERYGADARLKDVHFTLNNPLKAVRVTGDMASEIDGAQTIGDYLGLARIHLDLAPQLPQQSILPVSLEVEDLLAALDRAIVQVDSAFIHLTPLERQQLRASVPLLLEHFAIHGRLDLGTRSEYETHRATLLLAKKVRLQPLFAAAAQLERLVTTLRKPSALYYPKGSPQNPSGTSGPLLYARNTPLGWILVGSKKANFYGRNDILCILELGGDDVYAMGPLSTHSPGLRLYIDYAGNDRYINGAGSTIGGIGFLVDYAGDDIYTGRAITQGASFCGIGLLWDVAGNDQYISKRIAQGCAFFGAALLIDSAGNDAYTLAHMGQGLGGMLGWGLLADLRGDDFYLADHQAPSSYGITDEFSGWAQGVGYGFRGQGSGGIGILYDRSGDDRYQAGEFSQGLGYFFSLGFLYDQSGNDAYRGRRYTQGASAHQAIGVLFDRQGNDQYRAKTAAGQGSGWDASIGLLRDGAGDDVYRAEHLSQGAAAMNSWGLLIDEKGRDRYEALSGQGLGGSTKYWGGRSAQNVGGLVDLGDQPDRYNQAERSDGQTNYSPGIGLFLDR